MICVQLCTLPLKVWLEARKDPLRKIFDISLFSQFNSQLLSSRAMKDQIICRFVLIISSRKIIIFEKGYYDIHEKE